MLTTVLPIFVLRAQVFLLKSVLRSQYSQCVNSKKPGRPKTGSSLVPITIRFSPEHAEMIRLLKARTGLTQRRVVESALNLSFKEMTKGKLVFVLTPDLKAAK